MGIFGFGALREHFSVLAKPSENYIACFDVTPLVVYALRNSANELEFARLFRYRMATCRELQYLREHPPRELCYTLDNRAPRAKRQTQLQRIVAANSLLSRLTVTGANISSSSNESKFKQVLRIADVVHRVRDILLKEFNLNRNRLTNRRRCKIARRDVRRNNRRDADESTSWSTVVRHGGGTETAVNLANYNYGIYDVDASPSSPLDITEQQRLDDDDASLYCSIEFDYYEGEGEIKAINWLTRHGGDNVDRLVMARDNDVYVYVLSKMQQLYNDENTKVRHGSGRLLVYHENSDRVLSCWTKFNDYSSKSWMILLWMSMCFGNDFAYGLLHKSVDVIRHCFLTLEREFFRNVHTIANLRTDLFHCDDDDRAFSNEAFSDNHLEHDFRNVDSDDGAEVLTDALCRLQDILRNTRKSYYVEDSSWSNSNSNSNDTVSHDGLSHQSSWRRGQCENKSSRPSTNIVHASHYDSAARIPTDSFASFFMTMVRREPDRQQLPEQKQRRLTNVAAQFNSGDTPRSTRPLAILRRRHHQQQATLQLTYRQQSACARLLRSAQTSTASGNTSITATDTAPTNNNVYFVRDLSATDEIVLRLWFARQIWSFFYIMELPSNFTSNQYFANGPAICINAAFDKPRITRTTFLSLKRHDIHRMIRSVLSHGI